MITASHLLTLLGLIMCNYFIQPLYQCFSVQIFNMNRNEEKGENDINHPSSKANHIYLLFDPVHLLKNIRNNLFKSINYQPIWKKHLNCRIKQCIVKITNKVYLLIKFWSKYICSHKKLLPEPIGCLFFFETR